MGRFSMTVAVEALPLAKPFHITGFTFESMPAVVVTLDDGNTRGRGEGSGVYYLGDDLAHMRATLDEHRAAIEGGIDRDALRAHDRPVVHAHLGSNLAGDLATLERAITRALA